MERDKLRKTAEILLTAMLFKDIEWDVVKLFGGDLKNWENLSRKVIYRLKNKPYELEVDVENVRNMVSTLLSSGANFNVKAFGKRTNTNTLLSAVALSLLPAEQAKEAVTTFDYEEFTSILVGEAGQPFQTIMKYDPKLFWTDVLYLLQGKINDDYQEYMSLLYYGDITRFLRYAQLQFSPSFREWNKTTTFLADAVDSPDIFHSLLSKNENKITPEMLKAVRVEKIGHKELETVRNILKTTPSEAIKHPATLIATYLLSQKEPHIYPFVYPYEKLIKSAFAIKKEEKIEITPSKRSKTKLLL